MLTKFIILSSFDKFVYRNNIIIVPLQYYIIGKLRY